MPQSQVFNIANMSLKAIRENKILAKMSEFTVFGYRNGLCYKLIMLYKGIIGKSPFHGHFPIYFLCKIQC